MAVLFKYCIIVVFVLVGSAISFKNDEYQHLVKKSNSDDGYSKISKELTSVRDEIIKTIWKEFDGFKAEIREQIGDVRRQKAEVSTNLVSNLEALREELKMEMNGVREMMKEKEEKVVQSGGFPFGFQKADIAVSQYNYTLVAANKYCYSNGITHHRASNLEKCQQLCEETPMCRAMEYIGKWMDNCYLLTKVCNSFISVDDSYVYSKN